MTPRAAKRLLAAAALSLASCAPAPIIPEGDALQELLADCRQCADERQLKQAAQTPAQLEFVRRVNAIEGALTGRPLVAGNRVRLLPDGPMTHRAQLEAIREAKHHVHLITYILTDGEIAQQYLHAFADRRKAGVTVRLMFDSMGGRTIGDDFRAALQRAGIEVREFGPMDPTKGPEQETSRRHHRKVLVVDGRVAFTGGINISDEYSESPAASKGAKGEGWRDTHIRIDGPAVAEFQKLFFDSWQLLGKIDTKDEGYWPKLRGRGNDLVRAITQRGNDLTTVITAPVANMLGLEDPRAKPKIYASYLAAITGARGRIWITQAYFIPNQEFLDVLVAAARRGVDVRVLVPGTSDIKLMVHGSRFHYAPLLEAGARIFEYEGPVLHAKTAVVDGVWATVGSSNLDYRSFIHNDEANAIIIGHDFGAEMEQMFQDDLKNAKEITRDQWAKRPWSERVRQRGAWLLKYWI